METRPVMLDLEAKLLADEDGTQRQALIKRLTAMQTSLQTQRRQLNDRERFRALQAASSAVDAALSTIRTLRVRPD